MTDRFFGGKTINNVCRLYYREEADIELPPMGQYATGICFVDEVHHAESEAMFQEIARECSLQVSCVPHDFKAFRRFPYTTYSL